MVTFLLLLLYWMNQFVINDGYYMKIINNAKCGKMKLNYSFMSSCVEQIYCLPSNGVAQKAKFCLISNYFKFNSIYIIQYILDEL